MAPPHTSGPASSAPIDSLPPEALAFAQRMYDSARAGSLEIFQQALTAGLPANMTNENGDSLVRLSCGYGLEAQLCVGHV
jgi:hypothetical protein